MRPELFVKPEKNSEIENTMNDQCLFLSHCSGTEFFYQGLIAGHVNIQSDSIRNVKIT